MEPINYKCLDKYTYFESNDECYYISSLNIIIDKNKQIFQNSNISLKDPKFLNLAVEVVNKINLTANIKTYNTGIFIQHWFTTYGHFKDELFNLYNFYTLFNKSEYNVFMNYNKPNHIGYEFHNYDKLSNLLFNSTSTFTNIYSLNENVIKIKSLILINHDLNSPMFHMFPEIAINKILLNIQNSTPFITNIFITRSTALHLPRNLNNQSELEQQFLKQNYDVINPETLDINLFINKLTYAKNIFITWGGAMTNLCYASKTANIYLLQSTSYAHENIFAIFKFLKNYKNLHLIKCNDDNTIHIDFDNFHPTKIETIL